LYRFNEALTPTQVKSFTETAHDLADDLGFNGRGVGWEQGRVPLFTHGVLQSS
jgi:hypothetical protein